jgi:hypothetical protein
MKSQNVLLATCFLIFFLSCNKKKNAVKEPVDSASPVISLKGAQVDSIGLDTEYDEPGFTVTDDFDQTLESKVKISGTVNTKSPGLYTLKYDVSDAAGHAAVQRVRYVQVINQAWMLGGDWLVKSFCINLSLGDYTTAVTVSDTTNGKIYVNPLLTIGSVAGHVNDSNIIFDTIRKINFSGTGVVKDSKKEMIFYTNTHHSGHAYTCTCTLTKQ